MAEGLHRLPGVEIWAAGEPRGKLYTPADLGDMRQNFDAFSSGARPYLRVPAVLGHEEDLERTDAAASGWVERLGLSAEGRLVSDVGEMPRRDARLVKRKAYRTVSPEIYDAPPDGIPRAAVMAELRRRGKDADSLLAEARRAAPADRDTWLAAQAKGEQKPGPPPSLEWFADGRLRQPLGKMLRRVSFLGGEIPQNKVLRELPDPEEYSEPPWRPTLLRFREVKRTPRGSYICFSEVVPMDRQAMLAKLQAAGIDASKITDAVPDDVLAQVCRLCDGGGGKEEFGDADYDGDMSAMPQDKMAKMREHARKHLETYAARCRKMGEDPGKLVIPGGPAPGPKQDLETKALESKFAELRKIADSALAKAQQAEKYAEQRLAGERKDRIGRELKDLVAAGKVLPAELDGGLADVLASADATTVHKFSENGKEVHKTAYDRLLDSLKARPVLLRFAERTVKGRGGVAGGGAKEEAHDVLRRHVEKFSEEYAVMRKDADTLIKEFDAQTPEEQEETLKLYREQLGLTA